MKVLACLTAAILMLATPAAACTGVDECTLGDRGYHLREPAGWDGVSPLPVLLHFHGWGRQGQVPVQSPRTGGAAEAAGVLFVAPNGLGRTWDFRRSGSPDTDFTRAVLADVAARYPIQGQPLIVSGYSWGALMAARFACDGGARIDALLLIAGAFPPGTPCAGTPDRVSHVHGTTDTVLDFPYGPGGDPTQAVALWKDEMGCGPQARQFDWKSVPYLTQDRREWDCDAGLLTMDIHSASHLIPRNWVARHLQEILDPQG
ncbi:alpha/beta hydrolase family esterase [Jannaschia donghaensis]|uniref:Poly(3-hydroxybutyrate) depolymerase n=1 Tax=Jannaschia donghaensis TaxID=420998 RepID=A0A0M6YHR7_9RHOB|nr:alpha/beta fold hydrolase [Jannaschia donghaensis]CTQ49891.1 Poly(3-hydroxybutyrate) depolymerase [Jannaschia donghaensis]